MGQWGHGIRDGMLRNGAFHSLQEKYRFNSTRAFSPEHTRDNADHLWSLEALTGVVQSKMRDSNSVKRCKKCYKYQGINCSPCSLWVGEKEPALVSNNGDFVRS